VRKAGAATGHRIFSLYFRCSNIPSAQAAFLDENIGGSGADISVTTVGKLRHSLNGVVMDIDTSPVVADNQWHLLDVYYNTTANPWVLRYALDGVENRRRMAAHVAADTGSATTLWIGHQTTATGATFDYDDLIRSTVAADFPLGAHKNLWLVPTFDGTHAAGSNVIEANDGTDIGVATAFDLMDEWPANTADYVQQVANGGSNYAEVGFTDIPTSENVYGVMGYMAGFASAVSAMTGADTRIVTDLGVPHGASMFTGDMSETALHYRVDNKLGPSGNPWSPLQVNRLRMQVGRATDVSSSQPRWSALGIAVCVDDRANPVPPISLGDLGRP
jgi:hypothetical protein